MKLNNIMENTKYTLYVDLDGVMADLQTYIEELVGIKLVTGDDGNWTNDEEVWEKVHSIDGEPQFDKLSLMPDALELWNYIKDYQPNILTATGQPVEENTKNKRKWVRSNLEGANEIHCVETSVMKAELATPTSILIDDRTKSTKPWEAAGGIAIQHTSAKDTIRQLKELGL